MRWWRENFLLTFFSTTSACYVLSTLVEVSTHIEVETMSSKDHGNLGRLNTNNISYSVILYELSAMQVLAVTLLCVQLSNVACFQLVYKIIWFKDPLKIKMSPPTFIANTTVIEPGRVQIFVVLPSMIPITKLNTPSQVSIQLHILPWIDKHREHWFRTPSCRGYWNGTTT